MPTKRTIIQSIDASGKVASPLLVTKTQWQAFSEKAGWFLSGLLAGIGLAACSWLWL
jgi:hypothetical protein